jgi:hypothetical protein
MLEKSTKNFLVGLLLIGVLLVGSLCAILGGLSFGNPFCL